MLRRNDAKICARCQPYVAIAGSAVVILAYGAYVLSTWKTYGSKDGCADGGSGNETLNRFMPVLEVSDVQPVRIAALPTPTYPVAQQIDLRRSSVVREIFEGRPGRSPEPQAFLRKR